MSTLAALALLAAWGAYLFVASWNHWAPDLSALYIASYLYGQGYEEWVYGAPEGFFGPRAPAIWRAVMHDFGLGDEVALPYLYPPIWAALFSAITPRMTPIGFSNAVYAVQIPLLLASYVLAWRISRPVLVSLVGWLLVAIGLSLLTYVVLFGLFHNQPQITVVFLTLLAFERYLAGGFRAAGIALAVAATIKVTPAIFALIFLADRNWRAVVPFVLTGAAITAASFAIAGPELHWAYLERAREVNAMVAGMNPNFSTEALLYQLSLLLSGETFERNFFGIRTWAEPLWLTVSMKLILVAGLAALFWRTRGLDEVASVRLRVIGITLLVSLTGPLSWAHYFSPVVFFAPLLLELRPGPRGWAILGAFSLALSKPVFLVLLAVDNAFYLAAMLSTVALWAVFVMVLAAAPRTMQASSGRRTTTDRAEAPA